MTHCKICHKRIEEIDESLFTNPKTRAHIKCKYCSQEFGEIGIHNEMCPNCFAPFYGHICQITKEISMTEKWKTKWRNKRKQKTKITFYYKEITGNDRAEAELTWLDTSMFGISEPIRIKGPTLRERVAKAVFYIRERFKSLNMKNIVNAPPEKFLKPWAIIELTPDDYNCYHHSPNIDLLVDDESLFNSCEFVDKFFYGEEL